MPEKRPTEPNGRVEERGDEVAGAGSSSADEDRVTRQDDEHTDRLAEQGARRFSRLLSRLGR
jgi:hypothetical protein